MWKNKPTDTVKINDNTQHRLPAVSSIAGKDAVFDTGLQKLCVKILLFPR